MLRRNLGVMGGWAGGVFLFALLPASGQSLGEVARQSRSRKQKEAPCSQHVYTNEDLSKPQILRPADRKCVEEARRKSSPAPAEEARKTPAAIIEPAEIPLGDVARYYRLLKELGGVGVAGTAAAQPPETTPNPPGVQAPALPTIPAEIPLGDVARYYRLLKELQEKDRSVNAAPAPARPAVPLPPPTPDLPAALPPSALPKLTVPEPHRHRMRAKLREFSTASMVEVHRGDSLWKLSRRYLGRGTAWQELAALNPEIRDPRLLRIGQRLRLPESARTSVGKTRRVRTGDTLWTLARLQFGNGLAWSCLAQANPQIVDANLIYPGQTLSIPLHCSSAR